MKKRLLAILICAFMITGLLPGTAVAVSTYVTVGGVELDGTAGKTYWKNGDTTSATGTETDYNAYFNSSTGILTLKDAVITGSPSNESNRNSNYGIYSAGDLTITLEGTNAVTAGDSTDYGVSSAIYANGNLIINGSGSVVVTGGTAPGYTSVGIYGSTLTIQDSVTVTATGGTAAQGSAGVNGVMGVIISGSASVTATGGKSNGGSSNGVVSNYGSITVSGSPTVIAIGGYGASSYGLRTEAAADPSGSGLSLEGGIVTAIGGKAAGTYGVSYGVCGYSYTTYTDGLLVAKGETYAINGPVTDGEANTVTPLTGAYGDNFAVYGAENTYHVIQGENNLDYTGASKPTNVESHITWTEAQGSDPATLTLNNVIINTGRTEAIKLPNGAKLLVQGVNIVHKNDVEDNGKCIYGIGALEISGMGTLFAIDGAALLGGTCSHGIAAVNDLTVSGGVKLTAIGGTAPYNDSYGVHSGGTTRFSGGTITVIGGMAENGSYGVYAHFGTEISGGRITAIGGAAQHSFSISAGKGGFSLSNVSIIAPAGAGISETGSFIATTTGGNLPASFAFISAASTPIPQPVAQIESTHYPTLADALTAVQDGQTIKLLQDVTHNSTIIVSGKTFTIDVNDFTLTVNTTNQDCIRALEGYSLYIVDNGTSDANGAFIANASGSYSGIEGYGVGQILIEVPSALSVTGDNTQGIWAYGPREVFLNGDITVTGNGTYGVYAVSGRYVTGMYGSLITINGVVKSDNMIRINEAVHHDLEDCVTPTTKAGYLTFVDPEDSATDPRSTVWLREAPSNDATLSELSASGITLTPAFDSETTRFTANVSNRISSTTVSAVTSDASARVTINGTEGSSKVVPLNVGNNTITVTVTAEDATTTKTYTININRATSSTSGGSSYTPPKYPVTDSNQGTQAGGQTILSKEHAEAGDTVIITVTPDKGYESGNPVVLDSNKNPLAVTDNGDGTFSFKMPAGGVTVETDFTRIDYFDDVNEDDWFDEASWFCAAHGLMQGTGNRQFDGHMGTNRAMLVTVLYRLANSTDSLDSIFDDVESGKWYSDAIGWAARNKIVEGYGNGKFGPNDALTREQMVSVLYRYSLFMKYDIVNLNDLDTFTDTDAISEWALEAMKWAVGNGIVEGIGNNLVSPETGATRAQFAAMMQRYATTIVK